MTEPNADPATSGATAKAVGRTLLLVGALVSVAVVIAVVMAVVTVRGIFTGDGPPSCDSAPVVLGWDDGERGWRRSEPFALDASQTVQVDVRLFATDGGVIQVGSTVYAVPAGEPFPDFGDTSTTSPFGGVRVGHGREAVNEQVRLDAGDWEIMVRGGAGPVEVRWPC